MNVYTNRGNPKGIAGQLHQYRNCHLVYWLSADWIAFPEARGLNPSEEFVFSKNVSNVNIFSSCTSLWWGVGDVRLRSDFFHFQLVFDKN